MARPKKLNANWFPHDANARNVPEIKAIRRKFSHIGYAAWNYLQETLTSSDNFQIPWDDVNIELLAADYDMAPNELAPIIEYAIKIGLLELENGYIFSSTHRNSMIPLMLKRKRDRESLTNQGNEAIAPEIADELSAPITRENPTKTNENKRKPQNKEVFDTDNSRKPQEKGVIGADNSRKHDDLHVIGGFPVFYSNSKSNSTHTVEDRMEGGVGETKAASSAVSDLLDWIAVEFPMIAAMSEPLTGQNIVWMLRKYSVEDIKRIIAAMHNKRAFENVNAYATFTNFAKYDKELAERRNATGSSGPKTYTWDEVLAYVDKHRGKATTDDFDRQVIDGVPVWFKKSDLQTQQLAQE